MGSEMCIRDRAATMAGMSWKALAASLPLATPATSSRRSPSMAATPAAPSPAATSIAGGVCPNCTAHTCTRTSAQAASGDCGTTANASRSRRNWRAPGSRSRRSVRTAPARFTCWGSMAASTRSLRRPARRRSPRRQRPPQPIGKRRPPRCSLQASPHQPPRRPRRRMPPPRDQRPRQRTPPPRGQHSPPQRTPRRPHQRPRQRMPSPRDRRRRLQRTRPSQQRRQVEGHGLSWRRWRQPRSLWGSFTLGGG